MSIQGSIHLASPQNLSADPKLLLDIHCGAFVAVDVIAPGTEHCVTARKNGELQVWSIDTSLLEGAITLGMPITAMSASPFGHLVVVGTDSGHMFYVDVTKPKSPRIIRRVHMHSGPVKQIV